MSDVRGGARGESGGVERARAVFDLDDVVGDALRALVARAERSGVELVGRIDAGVPRALRGDPVGLRDAIADRVSNAIASARGGEVELRVSRESAGVLCLGVGTSPFTVRCEELEPPGEPLRRIDAALGARALIASDRPAQRAIWVELAERWGLSAVPTASASQVLRALCDAEAQRAPIALVLLDAQLPGADGLALAGEIRANSALDELAVVLLAPAAIALDASRCAQLRIAARVVKPVKEYELYDAVARAFASRASEAASAVSRRILLVEDSPANQKVALAILAGQGHRVVVASDACEALALVAAHEFDAILLDVELPGMDGCECATAIRSAEANTRRRVPIVALTAHVLPRDRARCLAAGMDDYVAKPIRRDPLLRALANAVRSQRR